VIECTAPVFGELDFQLVDDLLDALDPAGDALGLLLDLLAADLATQGDHALGDVYLQRPAFDVPVLGQTQADLVVDPVVVGGAFRLRQAGAGENRQQE